MFFQINAQQKIKFNKENSLFVFYKSGANSDSLIKETDNNTFIYIVPDSLKKYYVINCYNCMFTSRNNDSLLHLRYSKGLQYQLIFEKTTDINNSNKKFRIKSQINGACNTPVNQIKLELLDLKNEQVLLTNNYYLEFK